MLQIILNLEGVTVLNKKQQKVINGGRAHEGCGFVLIYDFGGGTTIQDRNFATNMSKEQALDSIAEGLSNGASSARWCCASCSTASWLDLP